MSLVRNVSTVSCLLAGLFGCAAFTSSELIVYQDSKFSVSLVPDPSVDTSNPSTFHDHPVRIKADQILNILGGVEVDRSRGLLVSMVLGPQREHAFSGEELTVLAPHIAMALSRASSKDRISVVVSRVSNTKTPETMEWALWVQRENLYLWLTRHQIVMDRQQSELTSTLESGATRGPGVSHDLPGDLTVGFSYPEYVVALEPTVARQLFGNPKAHVVIDYSRFLSDARPTAQLSERRPSASGAGQTSRPQDQPGASTLAGGVPSGNSSAYGPSTDVQALGERVKTLEAQVNDLLGVVKQLTRELGESNKALAAREEELRTLRSVPNRSGKPRSSQSPFTSP